MQRVYCTYEKDWMGFKISKRNFLTFHHITKRCMKGLEDIDNGALLGKKSHELLNMIEIFDEDLYIADRLPSFNTMTELLSEIKSDGTQIYGTEKPQNANEKRFKINNEDDVANFLFLQFRYYHHTKDKKAVFSGDNFKIHLVFS